MRQIVHHVSFAWWNCPWRGQHAGKGSGQDLVSVGLPWRRGAGSSKAVQGRCPQGRLGGCMDPEMPEAAALPGRVARGREEPFPGVCGAVRPGRAGGHSPIGGGAGEAVPRRQERKEWEAACRMPGKQGEPAGAMRRQHGHPDVAWAHLRREPCGDCRASGRAGAEYPEDRPP